MTSDKAYTTAAQLAAFITAMGGLSAHGYQTAYLMANAPQCSSTSQVGTGLAVQINQTGVQYFWEVDCYVAAQSNNGMYITMAGPTTSSFDSLIKYEQLFQAAYGQNNALSFTTRQTAIGVNTGLNATMVNGGGYWVHLQGQATFTATGTLTVNQASTANVASFTVQQGSRLRVFAG